MGTHPIFESDFDCLTDSARQMSLTDIAKRHREAKLAKNGEKLGLVKKTKEKGALSLGELLKKKKGDSGNSSDKGLDLSSLVKKTTKQPKLVVTREEKEQVEIVTAKVDKLEIKASVYKRVDHKITKRQTFNTKSSPKSPPA